MSTNPQPGQPGKKLKASPVQIARALKGIDYPKSKKEIIEYAQRHNVDRNPNVIKALEKIPDKQYGSMADVEGGFGEMK